MKKIILCFCLLISSVALPAFAQTDKLIDELSNIKGITYVSVSESMLGLIGNRLDAVDVGDVNLENILPKLKSIKILNADEGAGVKQMRSQLTNHFTKLKLEALVDIKEDGEVTKIYFSESKDFKKEYSSLIIYADEGDEISLILLNGTFQMNDLKNLMNQ